MLWAIIVLAIMNISTFITILIHSSRTSETTPELSEQFNYESSSVQYSGRYFRDHLNLSKAQMSLFSEFNPEFRRQVRNINLSLVRMRQQMIEEMAAETSDTLKLNLLSDSIGHLHTDLKKLTYRYYMDFKNICNQEQQEKLEQMFGEMFATDIHPGQYGQRGPYGRGPGRRFNN